MIQINRALDRYNYRSTPYMIAKVVRPVILAPKKFVHALMTVIKFLFRYLERSRVTVDEIGHDVEKSSTEEALDEYRLSLEKTFGVSERTASVLVDVRVWMEGK